MNRFTIIIPIFNETESIFKLIDEIFHEFKKITPEIVIVDDGSTVTIISCKSKDGCKDGSADRMSGEVAID